MSSGFQGFVLFEEFPRIDSPALRDYIQSLEPADDTPCEVSDFTMRATEEGSVYSGVVSCGDLNVAIQVIGRALPEMSLRSTVEVAAMTEEDRDRLREHKVHATLTCLGGGDYHPIESMILLLKTGMALCQQGGVALANEHNCTCFPGDMLTAFAEEIRARVAEDLDEEPDEDDQEVTLWESLRGEGLPGELLVGFLPADIEGQIWCLSVGHAMFGLPELAYRADDLSEVEEVEEHFRNIFSFLFENGPVISPGHTMGYEGAMAFHFHELPPDCKNMEAATGTLLVTIECGAENEGPE